MRVCYKYTMFLHPLLSTYRERGGQYVIRGFLFVLVVVCFLSVPFFAQATSRTLSIADVIRLTNEERTERRIGVLKENETLKAVAQKKLLDLITKQYFAHESPTGEHASDIAKAEGYAFLIVGENLAAGTFDSPEELVKAWMDSPGHRENILSKKYTEIGVAAALVRFSPSPFNGRKVWVAVQEFGTQKSVCGGIDSDVYDRIVSKVKELSQLQKDIETKRSTLSHSVSRSKEGKKTVADFNSMVDSYNSAVRLLRKEVTGYNKTIEAYRSCVSAFLK